MNARPSRLPSGYSWRPNASAFVVGGGAVSANATPELTTLAEKLGIPVVFTWNGKGTIAEDNPMCAGTAG